MRVFISWSGDRSGRVAQFLKEWISCVLQNAKPWVSSKDIDRGSLWFSEISQQLGETSVGIICLTQENKDRPWILFEAGALAKGLQSSRVCTLLIDLEPNDIGDPLAQFNHTMLTKDSIWSLLRTINSALGEKGLDPQVLERVFDTYFPQFEGEIEKIMKETTAAKRTPRKQDDMLGEILEQTRSLNSRLRRVEILSDRSLSGAFLSLSRRPTALDAVAAQSDLMEAYDRAAVNVRVGDVLKSRRRTLLTEEEGGEKP